MADNSVVFPNSKVQFDIDSDLIMDRVLAFNDENPVDFPYDEDDPNDVVMYHDALILHFRDNSGETDPKIIAACNRLLKYV